MVMKKAGEILREWLWVPVVLCGLGLLIWFFQPRLNQAPRPERVELALSGYRISLTYQPVKRVDKKVVAGTVIEIRTDSDILTKEPLPVEGEIVPTSFNIPKQI